MSEGREAADLAVAARDAEVEWPRSQFEAATILKLSGVSFLLACVACVDFATQLEGALVLGLALSVRAASSAVGDDRR